MLDSIFPLSEVRGSGVSARAAARTSRQRRKSELASRPALSRRVLEAARSEAARSIANNRAAGFMRVKMSGRIVALPRRRPRRHLQIANHIVSPFGRSAARASTQSLSLGVAPLTSPGAPCDLTPRPTARNTVRRRAAAARSFWPWLGCSSRALSPRERAAALSVLRRGGADGPPLGGERARTPEPRRAGDGVHANLRSAIALSRPAPSRLSSPASRRRQTFSAIDAPNRARIVGIPILGGLHHR
jgi:hypothetical protein